jgi:hypothetical protein
MVPPVSNVSALIPESMHASYSIGWAAR